MWDVTILSQIYKTTCCNRKTILSLKSASRTSLPQPALVVLEEKRHWGEEAREGAAGWACSPWVPVRRQGFSLTHFMNIFRCLLKVWESQSYGGDSILTPYACSVSLRGEVQSTVPLLCNPQFLLIHRNNLTSVTVRTHPLCSSAHAMTSQRLALGR